MYSPGLREQEVMTVDLHQMTVTQARDWLSGQVTRAPREIREIRVIHGYRGGTALQNMVRKSFRHRRVEKILLGMNPGETILVLDRKRC